MLRLPPATSQKNGSRSAAKRSRSSYKRSRDGASTREPDRGQRDHPLRQSPGRVEEVLVDLGDSISAGQTLFKIDSQEYAMIISQATSQLAQARAAVGLKPDDPLESLNPENAPPVREARAVWTEAKQAVARLRDLDQTLSHKRHRS